MKAHFKMHRLKNNHCSPRPTAIMYLDVECNKVEEGDNSTLPFRLAVSCYVRRRNDIKTYTTSWKEWHDQRELCLYMASKAYSKLRLLVVTHNAEFDMIASGFLLHLCHDGWVLKFFYANGMTFICSCSKDDRKITIISTTNYFNYALKDMGKMLGLEKKEIDLFNCSDKVCMDYCRRDVEILKLAFESWLKVIDDGDYGGFKLTKASQALAAFRHRFMDNPIYIHDEQIAKKLERRSYCGGRCETFYKGVYKDGPFVKIDFNSNYAFVMKKHAYPTALIDIKTNPSIDEMQCILDSLCVVAEVVLNIDQPIFPVRYSGKLLFPVGTFKTVICTRGVELALKRGYIERFGTVCYYRARPIFRSYVDHFYSKKLEAQKCGNLIYRTVYKDILNSLYGKFAEQAPIRYTKTEYDGKPAYREIVLDFVDHNRSLKTKLLNTVFEDIDKKDTAHTFTAISSHVTEDSRLLLWSLYELLYPDNVLYSDTDSVIIRKIDLPKVEHLLDNEKLGFLAVEEEAEELELLCPKNYRMGDKIKRKGVPKKAISHSATSFSYESFLKLPTLLRMNDISIPRIKIVPKELTYDITKGKLTSEGKVLPFCLPQDVSSLPH